MGKPPPDSSRSSLAIPPASRALNSHSFFADPDPAVFLNADPNPALKVCKKLPYEEFSVVEKDKKRLIRSKKPWSWSKFTGT